MRACADAERKDGERQRAHAQGEESILGSSARRAPLAFVRLRESRISPSCRALRFFVGPPLRYSCFVPAPPARDCCKSRSGRPRARALLRLAAQRSEGCAAGEVSDRLQIIAPRFACCARAAPADMKAGGRPGPTPCARNSRAASAPCARFVPDDEGAEQQSARPGARGHCIAPAARSRSQKACSWPPPAAAAISTKDDARR